MSEFQNDEIRFLKLEIEQDATKARIAKVEERVDELEDDHTDQVNILQKLTMTVEMLSETVKTLGDLTKELDKGQEVFKARFNIVIAILSAIGIAVVTGVIKIFLLSGG